MKILICAYNCNPNKGKEEGRGWNIPLELSNFGNQVYVLTHSDNKNVIEQALSTRSVSNLHFIYIDDPLWFKNYTKVASKLSFLRRNIWQLRYIVWLKQAYKVAIQIESKQNFDVVHHLTMSVLQSGSSLWRLNKPFVIGPAGGGQIAPTAFIKYFLNRKSDEIRRSLIVKYLLPLNPSFNRTLSKTNLVLVTNPETAHLAERASAKRTELFLQAGLPEDYFPPKLPIKTASQKLRLILVGAAIPRKGFCLTFEALGRVSSSVEFKLDIFGVVPQQQEKFLFESIKKFKLENKVYFQGCLPWSDLRNKYLDSDVFILTSLRDTCPAVLIEAMAMALPIITLNHQGGSVLVPDDAGIKVSVTNRKETINSIAKAVEYMYQHPIERQQMSKASYDFAKTQVWSRKANILSKYYEEVLFKATK